MPKILFLHFLIVFSIQVNSAILSDTLRGEVKNEKGQLVAFASLTIENKYKFSSNRDGQFLFLAEGPLQQPLNIKIETEGYSLGDYIYLEDEKFLEINLKNVPLITEQPKKPEKTAVVTASKQLPPIKTKKETYVDTVLIKFHAYKSDIHTLVADLREERKRMEAANQNFRDEINRISEKLKTEKNLSKEQREELKNYILKLENTLEENTLAFAKAQERTNRLIQTLKSVIAEKDSLHAVTRQKLAKTETEKKKIEEKLNRNLVIFSIISFSLLLLAVVFYNIAYKMKKQKLGLLRTNEELLKAKTELSNKLEEIQTLNYKISHDIKGPVNSVMGLIDVGKKSIDDKKASEILGMIDNTIKKLQSLINEILNPVRATGDSPKELVKVEELLSNCIERLENHPGFNNLKINVTIPKNFNIYTDPVVLVSVFQNLIENAIKYRDISKEKSELNIEVTTSNDGTVIKFSDNGIGMKEEDLKKVFKIFSKVDPESEGSGVGLYISRKLLKKVGGNIEVESTEKIGTIFTITINNEKVEAWNTV